MVRLPFGESSKGESCYKNLVYVRNDMPNFYDILDQLWVNLFWRSHVTKFDYLLYWDITGAPCHIAGQVLFCFNMGNGEIMCVTIIVICIALN